MKKVAAKPEPQPANLSIGQIKAAIPKLERRLAEVEGYDPVKATDENDAAGKSLCQKIDETLIEVYGFNTIEFHRYRVEGFYKGPYIMGGTPRHLELKGYEDGKSKAISSLKTAIEMLREKVADAEAVPGKTSAPISLDGVDLHPALQAACGGLYKDGHYANAIETACKVLNGQVQAQTGIYDPDNTALMDLVFSAKKPVLAFNGLQGDADPYALDDKPSVVRCRLKCRAAENLILADETLTLLGTDWPAMQSKIAAWLQIAANQTHAKYAAVTTFSNGGFRRDSANVKQLPNFFMHMAASEKPWAVAVGQAISNLTPSSPNASGSLRDFLGEKAVTSLGLCR